MAQRKAGIIGDPISHSMSPTIHGHWLRRFGLNATYLAMHVSSDRVPEHLKALADEGYSGINVTVPHKERVFQLCDDLTPTARAIGAVNIVRFANGKYIGDNSDAYGFWAHLEQSLINQGYSAPKRDALIVLLGAGGAARAVLFALKSQGFNNIRIANRSQNKAEALASTIGSGIATPWAERRRIAEQAALIINSTSLGMAGQPPLFEGEEKPAFGPEQIVYDLVYKPLETELLAIAKAGGALAIDGLGMLLHQAVPSFDAFFGQTPTIDPVLQTLIVNRIS